MALARLSRWLCGGADDEDNTLKTDSKLSTDNRLRVDTVKTDNRVKVDTVKIEKTSVDVNVKAPKKLKIEGPDAVTVKHEVDVLGPALNTLSKPVIAVKNRFSRSQPSSPTSTSETTTKRSATVGSRAKDEASLTPST